jgi:hypothetical protein
LAHVTVITSTGPQPFPFELSLPVLKARLAGRRVHHIGPVPRREPKDYPVAEVKDAETDHATFPSAGFYRLDVSPDEVLDWAA